MKTCSKCKKTKNISEFGVDSQKNDGHEYRCNICCLEITRVKNQVRQQKKELIRSIEGDNKRSKLNLCGPLRPVLTQLGYTNHQVDLIAQNAYDSTGVDLVDEKCPYYDVCGVECIGRPFPKLQESTYHQIRKVLPNMVTTEYRGTMNYVAKQLQCDSCAIKDTCSRLCTAMNGYMLKNDCEKSKDGVDIFDSNSTHAFTLGYVGELEFHEGGSEKTSAEEYLKEENKMVIGTSPYCDGILLGDSIKGVRTDSGGSIYQAINTTESRDMLVSRQDIQWHILEPEECDVIYYYNIKHLMATVVYEKLNISNPTFTKRRSSGLKKLREAHEDPKLLKRHEMLRKSITLGFEKGISIHKMGKSLGISQFVVERYLDFLRLK